MAACMTVLIAGCSATDGPTARFDDYLPRLARTLGQDLTPPTPEPPYPDTAPGVTLTSPSPFFRLIL